MYIFGLNAQMMFYKGLFEKIGVQFDGLRCGAYKSALEPYTRSTPSEESLEMINWLLDSLYERWIGMIAEGRELSPSTVRNLVDQAPISSAQALESDLVDSVGSFSDFTKRIHKRFGADVKVLKRYRQSPMEKIDVNNPFALFELFSRLLDGVQETEQPGIGLVYVAGTIMVGSSDEGFMGDQIAGSTSVRAALDVACEDDRVKAVVLRVDSPGGSAVASDIIWQAAQRVSEEKPLIVSMGSVAGSGGYYVSAPGDVILADAATLTGSIGVLGGKIVWNELMADHLGITTTEVTRGQHADLFSAQRPWNEHEREVMREYIDRTYEQFKDRVRTARGNRLKKDLDEIAGGRVYTGAQALELGLVDRLGSLADALEIARERAGLPEDCDVYVLPRPSEFAELMAVLEQLTGGEKDDEFEVALRTRLVNRLGLGGVLPMLQRLAPAELAEVGRALNNLMMLQRERVGMFMPMVPMVR